MTCNKCFVEFFAFGFKHPFSDFYPGGYKLCDSFSCDSNMRITAADDYAGYPLLNNKIAAGRGFSEMGTWFKINLQGGVRKQCLVGDGSNGVYFGMRAAKLVMEAFTDNFAVVNNNRSYHRIRAHIAGTLQCKFHATAHIEYIIALGHRSTLRSFSHSDLNQLDAG